MSLLRQGSRAILRVSRRQEAAGGSAVGLAKAFSEQFQQAGPKTETAAEFIARWLDVTGALTRYHSRKAWILDQDPVHRACAGMITEFERKAIMVMQFCVCVFYPFGLWYWWGQWTHMAHKPPGPLPLQCPTMDNRKVPFNWHNQGQCNECRWLEFECRKMCYDRMEEEGIEPQQLTFSKWGLKRVRTQSFGTY